MITFEQALKLTEVSSNFKHKVEFIADLKFHIFSYSYSSSDIFEEYKDMGALEMRGLTFLEIDGDYICYPGIKKFFNVNEVAETKLDVLASKNIIQMQEKVDGSLIMPIMYKGKIYAKTIKTFYNEQTTIANNIISSSRILQDFITHLYKSGICPFFELVSPQNIVVLDQEKTQLRLIMGRELSTGLPIFDFEMTEEEIQIINPAKKYDVENIYEVLCSAKELQDVEGWVLTYEDYTQVKIKTLWYIELHRLIDDCNHENTIIKLSLENKLDDAVNINEKRREYIKEIDHRLKSCIRMGVDYISRSVLSSDLADRKAFAIKNKSYLFFSVLMKAFTMMAKNGISKEEIEMMLIESILKQTSTLNKAQSFITETLNMDLII